MRPYCTFRPFPVASRALVVSLGAALSGVACGGGSPAGKPADQADHPELTNRIHVPAEVVDNLGITFERARRGRLETRLAVPGRVEIAPDARFAVRAPVRGRVVQKAARWQRVGAGEVLAELVAPDLKDALVAIVEASEAVDRAAIDLEAARVNATHAPSLARAEDAAAVAAQVRIATARNAHDGALAAEASARTRAARLSAPVGDGALPPATLAAAQREVAEAQTALLGAARALDDAVAEAPAAAARAAAAAARASAAAREVALLERRLAVAEADRTRRLRAFASVTGVSEEALRGGTPNRPAWMDVDVVRLKAPVAGVVTELAAADGEWVEASDVVVRVVDPTRVLFRGEVPETDLARIPRDAKARVDVGCATCGPVETALTAPLLLADPRTRTVAVELALPGGTDAHPDGASATASLLLAKAEHDEVLVPEACVVRDELEFLVFRRDPADPAQVVRTPVALGRRADGWVEVLSGVGEGDEVVRAGVHQLKLLGVGKGGMKGHFHADGTWHEGDH